MDIKEAEKHWNKFGDTDPLWAILTEDDKRGNKWNIEDFFASGKKEIDELITYVKNLPVKISWNRALDFGCGAGRLTQALAHYFSEVIGIDISSTMVELANKHNQAPQKVKYQVNVNDSLRVFSENNFDFIYSNITLQHIEPRHTQKYLKEFIRILAPGGLLIFQLPSESSNPIKAAVKYFIPNFLISAYRSLTCKDFPRFEIYEVRKSRVIRWLQQSGAKIIDIQKDTNAGQAYTSYRYCVTRA